MPGIGVGIGIPFRKHEDESDYWTTLWSPANTANGVCLTKNENPSAPTLNELCIRQKLYNNLWNCRNFQTPTTPSVGSIATRLAQVYIDKLYRNLNSATTPAVTFGGAGWTHTTANLFGDYSQIKANQWHYSLTHNDYYQIISEDNATDFYIGTNPAVNLGCAAIVEIDGDRTLANQLPTAQALVTAGTLPNTILVANGGEFNPTDRVLEYYTLNAALIPIAIGLTPGIHTLKVTQTNHHHASSGSDPYLLLNNILVGRTDTEATESNLYFKKYLPVWIGDFPVDEFAYNIQPAGASNNEWIGHTGSVKTAVAPVYEIDGVGVTPTGGTIYYGDEIVIELNSDTFHSEVGGGATSIGTMLQTITLNQNTGLRLQHSYTLLVAGVVTGYSAMKTSVESLDLCTYTEAVANYALSDNDGSSKAAHTGKNMYAWDADGNIGVLFSLPIDVSMYYLDNPTWNKVYVQTFNGHAFNINDVWTEDANYKVQWFPLGANASLTK